MQIFFTSHTRFSLSDTRRENCGFSLIELLISVAIISVITSIIMVRFTTFDSTVVLKNKAYEAALLLRELQVKSVSVQRSSTEFDYSFGASFDMNNPAEYTTYYFSTSSVDVYPEYDTSSCVGVNDWDCAHDIESVLVGETHVMSDICYTTTSLGERCSSTHAPLNRIDITFRRPEFVALVNTDDGGFAGDPNSISNAKIKFQSNKPDATSGTFVVEVSKLGQISVYNE